MQPLAPEWKAECSQQRTTVVVIDRGGGDGHVETTQLVHLVILDFGKDDLFADAHGKVAAPIEGAGADTTEVAGSRNGDADQPIQELVHSATAQGDLAAHRPAVPNLESGDGLARHGDHRLLRSEERRVGKGCRSAGWGEREQKTR